MQCSVKRSRTGFGNFEVHFFDKKMNSYFFETGPAQFQKALFCLPVTARPDLQCIGAGRVYAAGTKQVT